MSLGLHPWPKGTGAGRSSALPLAGDWAANPLRKSKPRFRLPSIKMRRSASTFKGFAQPASSDKRSAVSRDCAQVCTPGQLWRPARRCKIDRAGRLLPARGWAASPGGNHSRPASQQIPHTDGSCAGPVSGSAPVKPFARPRAALTRLPKPLGRSFLTRAQVRFLSRAPCTLARVSVLGERSPLSLGDHLDGTVDHSQGGLVVDRIRGA